MLLTSILGLYSRAYGRSLGLALRSNVGNSQSIRQAACREPDLADVGDGRNPNCFLCQAIRSPLTYPPSHHQHRLISVAAHHLQVHFGAGLRLFPHTASIALLDHPLGSTCRRSCDIPPFLNRRSSFSHYNQFSRRPCTGRRIQRPSTEYYRPLSFL